MVDSRLWPLALGVTFGPILGLLALEAVDYLRRRRLVALSPLAVALRTLRATVAPHSPRRTRR